MSSLPVSQVIPRILLSLCFTLGSYQPLFADDVLSPRDWLERMMDAVQKLSYQGTFVYLHDNQLEIMKIAHAVEGDRVKESLISLNGVPREVIRDEESVTCVLPNSNEVSVDRRVPSKKFLNILPNDLAQLDDHYSFRMAGQTRIINRKAQAVVILPNDQLRYGYRFYLDVESGLPLKSDLTNEYGEPLEQTMFTDLQIGTAEISDVYQRESLYTYRLKSNEGVNVDISRKVSSRWDFLRLPTGFSLRIQHLLRDPLSSSPIEQYVFSDGLGSLSVFVEDEAREGAFNGVTRLGAINAWGGQVAGYQVTAVGEVPAVTIIGIVQGMRLKSPHD